jgi:hypothetical protein
MHPVTTQLETHEKQLETQGTTTDLRGRVESMIVPSPNQRSDVFALVPPPPASLSPAFLPLVSFRGSPEEENTFIPSPTHSAVPLASNPYVDVSATSSPLTGHPFDDIDASEHMRGILKLLATSHGHLPQVVHTVLCNLAWAIPLAPGLEYIHDAASAWGPPPSASTSTWDDLSCRVIAPLPSPPSMLSRPLDNPGMPQASAPSGLSVDLFSVSPFLTLSPQLTTPSCASIADGQDHDSQTAPSIECVHEDDADGMVKGDVASPVGDAATKSDGFDEYVCAKLKTGKGSTLPCFSVSERFHITGKLPVLMYKVDGRQASPNAVRLFCFRNCALSRTQPHLIARA